MFTSTLQSPFSLIISFVEKSWEWLCKADKITPLAVLILCIIGVSGIYSGGVFRGATEWETQIIYLSVGWIAYLFFSLLSYKWLGRHAKIIYAIGVAFLIPLAFCAILDFDLAPIIRKINGARCWYSLPLFSFQPSEIAKITTLILLAKILSIKPLGTFCESWKQIWQTSILCFIPFFLIFIEPDFGSSIAYIPMLLTLFFISNLTKKFFIILGSIGIVFTSIISVDIYYYRNALIDYYESKDREPRDPAADLRNSYDHWSKLPFLKNYQRQRLLSFIDPEAIDPKGIGASWNVRQSLISVGKGGFLGAGFNNGTQAKLGYLPKLAAHNDFLFSVLAEEYGFVGCSFILLLYGIIIFRALRISMNAKDSFGSLLASGIIVILVVHIVINIGMNIGLMPVTGLSIPFLSYGGSFILSCFILLGLLQNIHCRSISKNIDDTTKQKEIVAQNKLLP